MDDEIKQKVRELSEMKYEHIGEIIEKMSEYQIKYKKMLDGLKNEDNIKKEMYVQGLVDGINLMLEPLKKYNL